MTLIELSHPPTSHAQITGVFIDLKRTPPYVSFVLSLGNIDAGVFAPVVDKEVILTPAQVIAFIQQFGSFKDAVLQFLSASGQLSGEIVEEPVPPPPPPPPPSGDGEGEEGDGGGGEE